MQSVRLTCLNAQNTHDIFSYLDNSQVNLNSENYFLRQAIFHKAHTAPKARSIPRKQISPRYIFLTGLEKRAVIILIVVFVKLVITEEKRRRVGTDQRCRKTEGKSTTTHLIFSRNKANIKKMRWAFALVFESQFSSEKNAHLILLPNISIFFFFWVSLSDKYTCTFISTYVASIKSYFFLNFISQFFFLFFVLASSSPSLVLF